MLDRDLLILGTDFDAALIRCYAGGGLDAQYSRAVSIVKKIEASSPVSLAGLLVKARAAAWCLGDGEDADPEAPADQRLAASVVRDLLAISLRQAAAEIECKGGVRLLAPDTVFTDNAQQPRR